MELAAAKLEFLNSWLSFLSGGSRGPIRAMANIEAKQHILFGLMTVGATDLALVSWIVISSIRNGISPDDSGFSRDEQPIGFWLSIALVIALGVGFAAIMAYAVLVP